MSRIFIVQHCQSEHHINELTGGWTDTPLTELGKKQAVAVAKELKELGVTSFALYSSDLKRAYMTAEAISDRFSTEIISTELLREINNGESANKTKKWALENRLFASDKLEIDMQAWKGSETPRELYSRMSKFVSNNLSSYDRDIVIVSHGIALGFLICLWLQISPEKISESFIKGNAGGISSVSVSPLGQNVLTLFNNTTHLRGIK